MVSFSNPWLAVAVWMGLIFFGSSIPGVSVSSSGVLDFVAHKSIHLVEYSVLFVLLYRASRYTFPQKPLTASFLILFLFALSDEWHQSFVPGRSAKLTDVVIDLASAVVGWLGYRFRVQ